MRKFLLAIVISTLASVGIAQEVQVRADYPERYVVKKGDTLWDIAGTFLEEPWMWPTIWKKNPDIADPHWIYPGDILVLVFRDGKPVLEKLDDSMPALVVEQRYDDAIPLLPLDKLEAFLNEHRIVTEATILSAPYVIASDDGRVIAGAGDDIYARGNVSGSKSYGVYHIADKLYDPDTAEFLGQEVKEVGQADVISTRGDIATLKVFSSSEEIAVKDILLPIRMPIDFARYHPSAPDRRIEGKIFAVDGGVRNFGRWDIVMLNRGVNDGLRPGHVLAVYKQNQKVLDPVTGETVLLPNSRVGEVMVFRVYEKLSYAIVMRSEKTLSLLDVVTNP